MKSSGVATFVNLVSAVMVSIAFSLESSGCVILQDSTKRDRLDEGSNVGFGKGCKVLVFSW